MTENENTVYQEHDKFFKAFFQVKETFIDYLINFFPLNLRKYFNLDDFVLDSTTYITSRMDALYSDVVYRGKLIFNGKSVAIAFLLEHKSYPSKYIIIQLLTYMVEMWQKDIADNNELTFIIPIVIYQSDKKWNPKSMQDHFENIPIEFSKYLPIFDFEITKVYDYDVKLLEKIKGVGLLQSLFLTYKTINDKAYLENHLEELFKSFEGKPELLELLRLFIAYIIRNSELSSEEMENNLLKVKNKPLKSEIMSTYDSIFLKGEAHGEAHGEARGEIKQKTIGILKALKRAKLTVEEIAEDFEVSVDFVLKIKKDNDL